MPPPLHFLIAVCLLVTFKFWKKRLCMLCGLALQVPRQQLIQVDLLDKLPMATADLQVPAGGLTVPHIRTGEHSVAANGGCCSCHVRVRLFVRAIVTIVPVKPA
jgi:hypothetical protein